MQANLGLMFEGNAKISYNGGRTEQRLSMKMTFRKAEDGVFWPGNSSGEISSNTSVDTNDSLADISELNGERESGMNSEGGSSWHDNTNVINQQSDEDKTEEALTSLGNRKKKKFQESQSKREPWHPKGKMCKR